MKIDPERLKRLKTRATCGRCGNTFDAASRIVAAPEATTEPKLPRIDPAAVPVVQLMPKPSPSGATAPDLRDEMEELAREFAEAAARFTPVGVKRSAIGLPAAPLAHRAPAPAAPSDAAPASSSAPTSTTAVPPRLSSDASIPPSSDSSPPPSSDASPPPSSDARSTVARLATVE